MDCNMKKIGQKYETTFCDNMEGNDHYFCTTAEWWGEKEIEKDKNIVWINIPFKYKKHAMENIQASKISPSTTTIIAKDDSAEYNHYLSLRDIEALQYVIADKFCPTVVLPDTYTLTEN